MLYEYFLPDFTILAFINSEIVIVLIVLLLMLISGFGYFLLKYRSSYNKLKNENETLLREQAIFQKALSEKESQHRRELEDSEPIKVKYENQQLYLNQIVSYAKRVQKLAIPSNEFIKPVLKNFFVYFEPKSMFINDFYWISRKKNLNIVYCCDIPANQLNMSVMSLIINSYIPDIIEKLMKSANEQMVDPAEVLTILHRNLIRIFQNASFDTLQKRLGISLVLWATDSRQLLYSGINSSVYLIRKTFPGTNRPELEVHEFIGKSMVLGSKQLHREKLISQVIEINKDDMFYIFTDGFMQQNGGSRNKKFTKVAFKQLLMKSYHLKTDLIPKMIQKAFQLWKGDNNQTDDVFIAGIKF